MLSTINKTPLTIYIPTDIGYCESTTIIWWDVATGNPAARWFYNEIDHITDLAFTPNADALIAVMFNGAHFIDLSNGNILHRAADPPDSQYTGGGRTIAFNANGAFFALGADRVLVWGIPPDGDRFWIAAVE